MQRIDLITSSLIFIPQFTWPKPQNKYFCCGDSLCHRHFCCRIGAIFIPHWQHAGAYYIPTNNHSTLKGIHVFIGSTGQVIVILTFPCFIMLIYHQSYFLLFCFALCRLNMNLHMLSLSLMLKIFAVLYLLGTKKLFFVLLQKYLQSITVRVEEMRVKRRDAELWMSHRMLPENLRQRIRRYEQYRWQETRGVDEELLLSNLPKDVRRDIKRHLSWALLTRVSAFKKSILRCISFVFQRKTFCSF